jgi:hypothetical protein
MTSISALQSDALACMVDDYLINIYPKRYEVQTKRKEILSTWPEAAMVQQ